MNVQFLEKKIQVVLVKLTSLDNDNEGDLDTYHITINRLHFQLHQKTPHNTAKHLNTPKNTLLLLNFI